MGLDIKMSLEVFNQFSSSTPLEPLIKIVLLHKFL